MRTYKYKTIEACMKANGLCFEWAMSISQLIGGQIWSLSKEAQIRFELPDEEYWRLADMVVETLEFRGKERKEQVASELKRAMVCHYTNCGLPERLYIAIHGGKASVYYAAGQDYTAEIRRIRKCLTSYM